MRPSKIDHRVGIRITDRTVDSKVDLVLRQHRFDLHVTGILDHEDRSGSRGVHSGRVGQVHSQRSIRSTDTTCSGFEHQHRHVADVGRIVGIPVSDRPIGLDPCLGRRVHQCDSQAVFRTQEHIGRTNRSQVAVGGHVDVVLEPDDKVVAHLGDVSGFGSGQSLLLLLGHVGKCQRLGNHHVGGTDVADPAAAGRHRHVHTDQVRILDRKLGVSRPLHEQPHTQADTRFEFLQRPDGALGHRIHVIQSVDAVRRIVIGDIGQSIGDQSRVLLLQ